jgi:transcriptional regulator with XRE-family HTH domain
VKASMMKIRRITIGKSQKSLEEDSGIGQWRISLIERGLPPQPIEAAKISSALGVKPEDIFPNHKFGVPVSACFADNLGDTESPESVEL